VPRHDSIEILDEVGTGKDSGWAERKRFVLPLRDGSLEELKETDRSLGLIKVRQLDDLVIEPDEAKWPSQLRTWLEQQDLFGRSKQPLEKIPWKFKYKFFCEDYKCKGHEMLFVDWEVYQAWRKWRHTYGDDVLAKIREKFFDQMRQRDLFFFVGTSLRQHRYRSFLVLGLF